MLSSNDIPLNYQPSHQISEKNLLSSSSDSGGKSSSSAKKHQSMPVMRSPEKKKVTLADTTPTPVPMPDGSPVTQFKSPASLPALRIRSMGSSVESGDSPHLMKSPRSPRSEHEVKSTRRHQIESPTASRNTTITQTVTSATTNADAPPQMTSVQKLPSQRLSAPPNTVSLKQPPSEQMDALADLWINQLLKSSSHSKDGQYGKLTVAKINSLGRTDGKIDATALPDVLRPLAPPSTRDGKVMLNSLLNSALANHMSQSSAGKTMVAMLKIILDSHPELAAIDFAQLTAGEVDSSNALKEQMNQSVMTQAKACVDVIFGAGRKFNQSHLPPALLEFWKQLDTILVQEATKNPELSKEQILTARRNLAFDLLITRQIYPYALKPVKQLSSNGMQSSTADTAHAAPSVLQTAFANTLREHLVREWPSFFDDAIKYFDS
ncbi:MAG: hypothetical protein RI962_853 [Pseudomonadota bacterium]|jgi:hypothetical protein